MAKSKYPSLAGVSLSVSDDLDITDELVVLRWALDELIRTYRDGGIAAATFAKLTSEVVRTLNNCRETTAKIIFARQNVITPAEFAALMKAVGNVIQMHVTDPNQRRAIALKLTDLIKGLKAKGELDGQALEAGQTRS